MKKFALTAALGAASLGLVACTVNNNNEAADDNLTATENIDTSADDGTATAGTGGTTTTSSTTVFVPGARIVDEGGITYRIDPDGTRVRLGDSDARIVIDNGVRYRVDPGGARVRIDDRGLTVDTDRIRVPVGDNIAVEVNTN